MNLKNIQIKSFLDVIGPCLQRAEFFAEFGRAWKKAFKAMTETDKEFISCYVSVDSFDSFRRDAEKLMKAYKKKGYVTTKSGTKYWRKKGKLHRVNGPAIEYKNGDNCWYQDGMVHRVGGPASTYFGIQSWYENNRLHRLGGPAMELSGKRKLYYINGEEYSEKEYFKLCSRKNIEISVQK
jgi:hypothetical protein